MSFFVASVLSIFVIYTFVFILWVYGFVLLHCNLLLFFFKYYMRVDINVVYLNLSFYLSLFFYECNYLHALFFLKVGFCFTSLTTVCMMIFFVTKFFLKCKIEIEKLNFIGCTCHSLLQIRNTILKCKWSSEN